MLSEGRNTKIFGRGGKDEELMRKRLERGVLIPSEPRNPSDGEEVNYRDSGMGKSHVESIIMHASNG
jgi:hypothetical protein